MRAGASFDAARVVQAGAEIGQKAPRGTTFERRSIMTRIPMKRAWRLGMIGAAVSIAATVGALSYPGLIRAFNPQPDPPGTQRFGPLGVTANETARLNAANTKFTGESSERPCAVTLRIFDSTGNILAEDTKRLPPRQAAFIDVTGLEALAGRDSLRTEIWAAVAPSSQPACPISPSFELFDSASGRTLVALGGPDTSQ
jgi:hypothetical protein